MKNKNPPNDPNIFETNDNAQLKEAEPSDNTTYSEINEYLYNNMIPSMISILILASVLFWELSGIIEKRTLTLWFESVLIILTIRIGLYVWFSKTKHKLALQSYHKYLFILGSSLTATLWGILGSFLMPTDTFHQTFIIIIISGLVAGSTISLGARYLASILYVLLALVPIITWEGIQIINGTRLYSGIFIGMTLYLFYVSIVSYNISNLVQNNIKLKNKNINLSKLLRAEATHDALTGLYNRRYLDTYFKIELARYKRNPKPISIIMIDIDHFKNFNDQFGHDLGDAILREFGSYFRNTVRDSDFACRFGGEEFILVLPEADLDIALNRAEKIREGAKHISVIKDDKHISGISISIGVAVFPEHGDTQASIIEAADKALYRAKEEGRDRVYVA